MDDFIIARILRLLPEELPKLYHVSEQFVNVIKTDHILCKVHKMGLTPSLYTEAINADDFECVKYAFEHGCKFTLEEHTIAVGGAHPNPYQHYSGSSQIPVDLCLLALVKSNMECVKFLHENGCDITFLFGTHSAKVGNLEALKYYKENSGQENIPVDVVLAAAGNGQVECLKYILENDCEKHPICCATAAANGHLECMKLLFKSNCEKDDYICMNAIRGNHFECFKCAIENDCEFHYEHIFSASLRRPEIKAYIIEHEKDLIDREYKIQITVRK